MEGNSKNANKRKRFLLFFWISLLIHLIILLLFIFKAFEKHSPFIIIPLNKKDLIALQKKAPTLKKNELPASLKPRKSAFGATVFFDDRPQFTPPKAKLIGPKDQDGQDLTKVSPTTLQNPQLQVKKDVDQKPQEKLSSETKSKEQKIPEKTRLKETIKHELQIVKKDEPTSKITEAKKEEPLQKEIKPSPEEIAQKIKDIETRQAMISKAHDLPEAKLPKMQKGQTFGQDSTDKSPIVVTKKSIISMTKGYIENLKGNGNDWLERKGDDSKRPSFEELKYISYEEKVNWQLQSSWKQNFACNTTLKIPEGKAVVEFSIKADGTVDSINLLESSGSHELDQVILKSIEFASPFAPLPKHFETDNYKTGRIIHVTHHLLKF